VSGAAASEIQLDSSSIPSQLAPIRSWLRGSLSLPFAIDKACTLGRQSRQLRRLRPLKNTISRSRSQLKFPLPAHIFSSHPEFRHKFRISRISPSESVLPCIVSLQCSTYGAQYYTEILQVIAKFHCLSTPEMLLKKIRFTSSKNFGTFLSLYKLTRDRALSRHQGIIDRQE